MITKLILLYLLWGLATGLWADGRFMRQNPPYARHSSIIRLAEWRVTTVLVSMVIWLPLWVMGIYHGLKDRLSDPDEGNESPEAK